ncbi:MAG: NfeD family protein [candidate division KSB1 bacterium]|nr:NfeD family protein [candidate division KSB1 bacterium]
MRTPQQSLLMLGAMLFSLTIVFVFDDVLFYLLFERLLGLQLNLFAKIVVGVVIFMLNLGLAYVALKALRERPQTGQESMIGKQGIVVSSASTSYWVKVHGELWRATSKQKLEVGDRVTICRVTGLTLEVELAQKTSKGGQA